MFCQWNMNQSHDKFEVLAQSKIWLASYLKPIIHYFELFQLSLLVFSHYFYFYFLQYHIICSLLNFQHNKQKTTGELQLNVYLLLKFKAKQYIFEIYQKRFNININNLFNIDFNLQTMHPASNYLELVKPKQPKPEPEKAILKVGDKQIELPVLQGSLGPKMIDVRSLLSQANLLTYDPGFMCTSSCISNITYINGEKGQLMYRGYKIEDLAENSTYMETCYLLLYGCLPSASELEKFESVVVGQMMINELIINFYKGFKSSAHPMAIMVGVVGALSAFMHSDYDLFDPNDRQLMAIKLIAKMPTLAAYAYRTAMGLPIVYPKKQYGYMKNFLYMMFSNPMSSTFDIADEIIKALEVIWICHADHEQNASTSTVRIAGSSLANPFACIAAGIGSLWGPYHGGANEAVLTMLQQLHKEGTSIEEVIGKAKDKNSKFRLMGFGHRVYKNFDPRATIMQKMCYEVLKVVDDPQTKPLLDLALNLQKTALADEYFIKRKLYPNVDFYTGIVYKAIGIPKSMFTVLFAVSRSVGWMTQWCQMMNETTNRISRPRQLYVGPIQREYQKIQDREDSGSKIIEMPKLCKLTSLMKL